MTIHSWRRSLKLSSRCLQKCKSMPTTTNNGIHSWSSMKHTSHRCCPKKTSSFCSNKSKSNNFSPQTSTTTHMSSSSSINNNNLCKKHNFYNSKSSNWSKNTIISKTILLTLLYRVIVLKIVYSLLRRRWISVKRNKNLNSSLCTCLIIISIFLLIKHCKRGLKVRLRSNSFLKRLRNCLLRDNVISSSNKNLWTQLSKRSQ